MKIEELKIEAIINLCKLNKVKSLCAFGSVTRDDFNDTSDVDLVIDIDENDPFTYTDIYFYIKSKLEEILQRHVDLLEERALKNPVFKQHLDATKIIIYGC